MSFQDHALPTRHFPDTGTAAMEFLLKNHPLAKDNQELQAQNRELRAENQELANRLEKAFQETKAIRQRAERAEAKQHELAELLVKIAESGAVLASGDQSTPFSNLVFDLIQAWVDQADAADFARATDG